MTAVCEFRRGYHTPEIATNTLSFELAAERNRLLQEELPKAQRRTAAAHITGGCPMEGVALERLKDAEAKEAATIRRIGEIDGTLGVPWQTL